MVAKRTHDEVERELQEWLQLNAVLQTLTVIGDSLSTALSSIREGVENVGVENLTESEFSIPLELVEGALASTRDLQASVEELRQRGAMTEAASNAIAEKIDKLPMDHRTVLELRYRYGFTELEVCQRMKVKYKRIRQLHKQGIELLTMMG